MSVNFDTQTLPTILCCMCGVPIPSNPSNMCVNCLRSQVDITEGIPKQLTIQYCNGCGRYLNPPNHWTNAELESRELLTLCLKRVKGIAKVKLIDAGFVWTEPHSRRLKVKLTIQKEVFNGTILQQAFVVEYIVQNQFCEVCHRTEAKDTWNAVVQVRQKVDHKRTFFYLEQLIIKHSAHSNTINVKEHPDGLDFYYSNRSHARKFVDFLQAVVPIRMKTSEKLVSHDEKSHTANMKYAFSVEIVPVCKEDLVCLPAKLAASLGGITPLLICLKISTHISLIDPITLQGIDLPTQNFWTHPFSAICSSRKLIEYTIIDINPTGQVNGKFVAADVQCARTSDFGKNDLMFHTRTHLGHLLNPGDSAWGYDLSTANFNDADLTSLRGRHLPDVILIKKAYPERRRKSRQRHWKLRNLEKVEEEDPKKGQGQKSAQDYEMFMRDLEEDPEMRSMVNMYKAPNAEKIYSEIKREEEEEMAGEEFPEVGLEELMEDLSIV